MGNCHFFFHFLCLFIFLLTPKSIRVAYLFNNHDHLKKIWNHSFYISIYNAIGSNTHNYWQKKRDSFTCIMWHSPSKTSLICLLRKGTSFNVYKTQKSWTYLSVLFLSFWKVNLWACGCTKLKLSLRFSRRHMGARLYLSKVTIEKTLVWVYLLMFLIVNVCFVTFPSADMCASTSDTFIHLSNGSAPVAAVSKWFITASSIVILQTWPSFQLNVEWKIYKFSQIYHF